jgi:hypothetical protein
MYSRAPARMDLAATIGSTPTPAATIGTTMCSASFAAIKAAMSRRASTMRRSAPRPARSAPVACSIVSTWATFAP